MPSFLLALLASLPLLVLPPGVCPCHAFGLECDGGAGHELPGHDDHDGDCGCPKIKTLAGPYAPANATPDLGFIFAVVPAPAVIAQRNDELPPRPVAFARAHADPPLYLTLRALLC